MKYVIKQLFDLRNSEYAFMPWRIAEHLFDINDYVVVYEGDIELEDPKQRVHPENYLEHLFYIFNVDHPKDFKGHSLSVGDVVELDGRNYYCDSAGWKALN